MKIMENSLKVTIFCCSKNIDSDALMRDCQRDDGNEIKVISLPCSGKLNLLYMIKAFEGGSDGVMVITCPQDKCEFLEGNLRANKRAMAVDSLNEEIGLGRGRISVVQMPEEADKLVGVVDDFVEKIGSIKAAISLKTA
jgi:coenzyme F420-reducing hydrogenase delta subunit